MRNSKDGQTIVGMGIRCAWLNIGDGAQIPVQIIEKQATRVLIEAFQATPIPVRGVTLERQERLWVENYQLGGYFMALVEDESP